MFGRKSRSKNHTLNPVLRFFRAIISIVVLTALVLGVTMGAKELYTVDSAKFGQLSSSFLAMLHIKVDEKQVGQIAGKFAERISQTNLGSGVSTSRSEESADQTVHASKDVTVEVAIMSDVHDDLVNLEKALKKTEERGIKNVFLLGDLTGYGDYQSLTKVKDVLEKSGLKYYTVPGDHDLAQTLDTGNFTSLFGIEYGIVNIAGYDFLYANNAANYTKIPEDEISFLENNLPQTDFLLISQPLYTEGLNPPFNKLYMGSTNSTTTDKEMVEKQEIVKDQGILLLSLVRQSTSLKAVIAGDHHKSSSLKDPDKSGLMNYVVGAISSTLNDYPQKALQSSRFSILSIYQDGSYEMSDIVLDE